MCCDDGTYWLRVEQQWRWVCTATDAAITFNMTAKFPSSSVFFRVRPITLTLCNIKYCCVYLLLYRMFHDFRA